MQIMNYMIQIFPFWINTTSDDIYQINKASRGKSDFYWINTTSGIQEVYCNMELQCGGHKGGWTRVAQFDTSQGDPCPSGWTRITTPGANPKTMCQSENFRGCHSTIFSYYIHIISVSVVELKGKSYFRAYSVQNGPLFFPELPKSFIHHS